MTITITKSDDDVLTTEKTEEILTMTMDERRTMTMFLTTEDTEKTEKNFRQFRGFCSKEDGNNIAVDLICSVRAIV